MASQKKIRMRYALLALFTLVSTFAVADRQVRNRMTTDSLALTPSSWSEMHPNGKMAHSAYPVKLSVKGRSLRISSKYEQVLPIYTQGGTLYLAMQLTPGVNWLNGLPRGRYRINNRTINIR